LRGEGKRLTSPISAARVSASKVADPRDRDEQRDVPVGARDRRELLLERRDPLVEQVDDRKRLLDGTLPDRRHLASGERFAPVGTAEPVGAQPQPPLGPEAVDAAGRRGAQPHQVRPAPQPLPQLTLLERGDPERRHELPPAQLGQHARVDAVGLARERRDPLHAPRVGDLDLPARRTEPVPDPHGAAHHLDARLHVGAEPQNEPGEPVLVRRREPFRRDRAAD